MPDNRLWNVYVFTVQLPLRYYPNVRCLIEKDGVIRFLNDKGRSVIISAPFVAEEIRA